MCASFDRLLKRRTYIWYMVWNKSMNIFGGIYAFYKSAARDAFTLNKSKKKIVLRRTLMLNHLYRKYLFTKAITYHGRPFLKRDA